MRRESEDLLELMSGSAYAKDGQSVFTAQKNGCGDHRRSFFYCVNEKGGSL